MKLKTMLIVAAMGGASLAQAPAPGAPVLVVHLARRVQTDDSPLQVNTVAVVDCNDESVSDKAGAVRLGRTPWLNEKLTLTRSTIMARLASAGLKTKRIRFTGALKVVIERRKMRISAERIVKSADEFLKTNAPAGAGSNPLVLARPVAPVVVPESRNLALKPRLAKNQTPNYVRVEVAVPDGTPKPKVVTVLYHGAGKDKSVATPAPAPGQDAAAGAATPPRRPVRTALPIIGLGAKKGQGPILIKARQIVRMRIKGHGFTIIGLGEALQDGRQDDYIRIRNTDTRRLITAKVAPDGTVEPFMGPARPVGKR